MSHHKLLSTTQKLFARGFTFAFFSLSAMIFLTTLASAVSQLGPVHTIFLSANGVQTVPI